MTPEEVAARVRAGDARAAARLMRELDDERPAGRAALRALWPHTGRALVIGVTGTPGAGKSTLVDELVTSLRAGGGRVGVVAVDPSSPFSGGAILGDRIRMQRHTLDEGVFIRSLATRGQLGGLSRSTADVVAVLDALGCAQVLVETVGVGQDEVDVVRVADVVVVVTVPGLGDEVQALKAGVLEVADLLVINKADREGADRTARDLRMMLELRGPAAPEVEIVSTVATRGEGVPALLEAIGRFEARQRASGAFDARRRRRAEAQLRALLLDRMRREAEAAVARRGGLGALAAEVAEGRRDPYSVVDELIAAAGAAVVP